MFEVIKRRSYGMNKKEERSMGEFRNKDRAQKEARKASHNIGKTEMVYVKDLAENAILV